jgi:hypothetical protein
MPATSNSGKQYRALLDYIGDEYGAHGAAGQGSSLNLILAAIADIDARPIDVSTGMFVEGVPPYGKGKIQEIDRLIAAVEAMPSEVANP